MQVTYNGISVGDVVEILTGGPPMTVMELCTTTTPKTAKCRWYEGGRHDEWLPVETLKHVETKDDPNRSIYTDATKTFEVQYLHPWATGMITGIAQGETAAEAIKAYLLSGVPVAMMPHDGGGGYFGHVTSVDAIVPDDNILGGKGGYAVLVSWGKYSSKPGYKMCFDRGKELATV